MLGRTVVRCSSNEHSQRTGPFSNAEYFFFIKWKWISSKVRLRYFWAQSQTLCRYIALNRPLPIPVIYGSREPRKFRHMTSTRVKSIHIFWFQSTILHGIPSVSPGLCPWCHKRRMWCPWPRTVHSVATGSLETISVNDHSVHTQFHFISSILQADGVGHRLVLLHYAV